MLIFMFSFSQNSKGLLEFKRREKNDSGTITNKLIYIVKCQKNESKILKGGINSEMPTITNSFPAYRNETVDGFYFLI